MNAARIAGGASPRDWVLALVAATVLAVATGGVYRGCLRTAGVDVTLLRATRLSLASHCLNCVVPGGKLSSIVLFTSEADRQTNSPGRGAAGFFTASVVGRIGLTLVALATLPLTVRVGIPPVAVFALFGLYTAVTAVRVGVFALLHRRHGRLMQLEMQVRARLRRRVSSVRCDDASTWTVCAADQWARRATFLPAVCWSLLGKLAGGALVAVAAHAAGGSMALTTGVTIYAVASIAGSLSLLPVGMGVVELTMVHAFASTGLTIPQAAAALMIYRLFQLWLPLLVGAVGMVGLRTTSADVPEPVVTVTVPELVPILVPVQV
jgi:putative heme transporter